MVSEVSAIEVASTTLRRPGGAGATAASCSAGDNAPYNGYRETPGGSSAPCKRSRVRRISPSPGRKTRTLLARHAMPDHASATRIATAL